MTSTAHSARSIDDFLEHLYRIHKRRFVLLPNDTSKTSHDHVGPRIFQYRHYCLPPLPLLALCIANSSDATEILMLSYLLANPTFRRDMFSDSSNGADDEAQDDASSMQGAEYLAASIFLGMLIGGTILGFLSDQFGRRPALLAGLVTNATAGLLSSLHFLTPTSAQLTMWRFIAGVGIGATVPSLFSLASEWCPKEVRGAVVTLVASFWMVGSLFVSSLAWILFRREDLQLQENYHDIESSFHTWRIFAAVCALPSALGAVMVYVYVPESPRFLASRKREYELASVCNRMAELMGVQLINDALYKANTNMDDHGDDHVVIKETCSSTSTYMTDSIANEMDYIHPLTGPELRQNYDSGIPNTADTAASSNSLVTRLRLALRTIPRTLRILHSPQLLMRTTLPLQVIWFSLSFSTYGITTWINTLFHAIHLQNIYFNSFLFALANLPGNIASILYSDRFGRNRMLVGSLIGAAGGLTGFAFLVHGNGTAADNGEDDDSKFNARTFGIVLFACIFQMFSIISWNTIDIMTGELFPTSVRSAGMGICTACGRFGAMFAQFVFARLMMAGNGEGEVASVYVLVVAATSLLIGAGMPMFLQRDMTMGQLPDELSEPTSSRFVTLGCISNASPKDHLSDDEVDNTAGLQSRSMNEYDSIQAESRHRTLEEEDFLL
ncbi:hypothetical protein ACHAWU_001015 [Discostella pseudostelligera]|uniref:Major facilitator superfamily (MFS) profile domain-containing protein n=1 Tax=Discostella pseudostelligera TaxID=259834 RepID=A0ABD3MGG7_9STRA